VSLQKDKRETMNTLNRRSLGGGRKDKLKHMGLVVLKITDKDENKNRRLQGGGGGGSFSLKDVYRR
jgi:hypothetical protein